MILDIKNVKFGSITPSPVPFQCLTPEVIKNSVSPRPVEILEMDVSGLKYGLQSLAALSEQIIMVGQRTKSGYLHVMFACTYC